MAKNKHVDLFKDMIPAVDMGIKELIMGYQMIVPRMGAEFRNGFPLGYANRT